MSPVLETFIGNRPVRRAVVETAMATEAPFSAETLFRQIRKKYDRIGKATIYRTLNLLCEQKLFQEFSIRGGRRVYQPASDEETVLWVCDDCMTTRVIPAAEIKKALGPLGEKIGIGSVETIVEIHSRCAGKPQQGTCRDLSSAERGPFEELPTGNR